MQPRKPRPPRHRSARPRSVVSPLALLVAFLLAPFLVLPLDLFLSPFSIVPRLRAEPPFIRGDANASGEVDLSDAVQILSYLFHGEGGPRCERAADLNVDARIDLSDPISILAFLFSGALPPPPPYPRCGYPPAPEDGLSCEEFAPCAAYEVERIEFHAEPHELAMVVPTSPESAPVTVLGPELFDAMDRLDDGEPLLALREIPGFKQYLKVSPMVRTLRSLGWREDSYRPTVAIEAVADPTAPTGPSFLFDEDLLDDLTWRLLDAGAIDDGERIVGAEPEDVRGEGEAAVLLAKERADGTVRTVSCTVNLDPNPAASLGPPEDFGAKKITIEPRRTVDVGYGACEWDLLGFETLPPVVRREGEMREWGLFGGGVRRMPWGGTPVIGGESGDGWYTFSGPGPHHRLYLQRWLTNCLAPPTYSSYALAGNVALRVRVACWSGDGRKKQPPKDCDARIHAEAFYMSRVYVQTHAGWFCYPIGPNAIEAIAKDEAILSFRSGAETMERTAFSKAAIVRTGNSCETTLGFDLDPKLQSGFPGGDAATLGTKFGYSITDDNETGAARDLLRCEATLDMPCPAFIRLETKGKATLNARHRTQGEADVRCEVVGILFVGTAMGPNGPCLGNVVGGWLAGDPSLLEHFKAKGERLFRSEGSLEKIDWKAVSP